MSLNYHRVLEILRYSFEKRSTQGGMETVTRGIVPAVRHRGVHARVRFLYKGREVDASMSGWVGIEPAVDSARAAAGRFEVDADSEAEIQVVATITDSLSQLIQPDGYDRVPRINTRGLEPDVVVMEAPVWSTRGPLPELDRAEALLSEGRAAHNCLEEVKTLFITPGERSAVAKGGMP